MNTVINKVENILTSEYTTSNFVEFVQEVFSNIEFVAPDKFNKEYSNFSSHIEGATHVGNYTDPEGNSIIIAAVQLKSRAYVENSRSVQRNYAKKLIENAASEAAFIAFYTEGESKWRISFVRLDYEMKFENGKMRTSQDLTPAKRYSYLVGRDEPCHTAIDRFKIFIEDNNSMPTLDQMENVFSVEAVTNEFFKLYCEKFHQVREHLESNEDFIEEAKQHNFTAAQFTKKLMGQIVFLYFLQKKGWLGVNALPKTMTEKEYKNAFYSRGAKSREIIPIAYRQNPEDELFYLMPKGLATLNDEDETILAQCVKGQPWGTGPKKFMRKLFETSQKKGANFFDDYLEPLFYSALNVNRGEQGYDPILHCRIPFLSGGLFEPIDGYEWEYNDFGVPNELFSNRINNNPRTGDGILDIFDRYNFTMSEDEPLEREVAIDPEMLGKVFENLLDVNDRKSKGAFYTPREIVHYMCQESLINYLIKEISVSEAAVRDFILYGDFMKGEDTVKEKRQGNGTLYISEELYKLDNNGNVVTNKLVDMDRALENVRVADPAVGSGAFPLGMLNEIVRARQNISAYYSITMNPNQTRLMYSMERSPYSLKYQTIKNCIYAADIEPSAVDIAQLRLWLSLVIDDEINPNADPNNPLEGHRNPTPLPNLECNILCGDSLIDEFEGIKLINQNELLGTAIVGDQTNIWGDSFSSILPRLIDAQDRLFRCDDTNKKHEIMNEISAIKDMIILSQMEGVDSEIVEKYKESKMLASKPYVLWQLDFARVFKQKGGFDIVIGNPPYVKIQNLDEHYVNHIKQEYKVATGKFDMYVLFVEKAFSLIKEGGVCCYIQPHRFLKAGYGKGLRNFLSENHWLKKVVNFGINQVFDTATTYTGIFMYCKNDAGIMYAEVVNKSIADSQFVSNEWPENDKPWDFTCTEPDGVIIKIKAAEQPLVDVFEGVYQGIITPGDDKFILKGNIRDGTLYGYSNELQRDIEIEAEIVKPVLKGENIRRYAQPDSNLYVIYPHKLNEKKKTVPMEENELSSDYPKAYCYLLEFKDELVEKKIKYKTNPKYWYSLHRAREKRILDSEKIITPQLQNYCNFAIDTHSMYPDAGGYMLIIKPEYASKLLFYYGILNSSLFYHFIKGTSTAFNNNYYYFKTAYIEQFRFPVVYRKEIEEQIINAVKTTIEARMNNDWDVVVECEKAIDEHVYLLYGLSETEINSIETRYDVK